VLARVPAFAEGGGGGSGRAGRMSDERPSTRSYAGWGLGGLIIVYFGFPALWIWPIWKVFGMSRAHA
jgi:hypothetical protein